MSIGYIIFKLRLKLCYNSPYNAYMCVYAVLPKAFHLTALAMALVLLLLLFSRWTSVSPTRACVCVWDPVQAFSLPVQATTLLL